MTQAEPERDRVSEMAAAVVSTMSGIEATRQRVDELLAHRDHLVCRMVEMGCSRPEIARLTGLSKSNVRWITERQQSAAAANVGGGRVEHAPSQP